MSKKLKIGVTGGIASGKSTVCKMFEANGYPVFYADDIGKELLQSDPSVKQKITAAFGQQSYIDGQPDKKFLAQNVFGNPEKLLKINSIIHPPVMKKLTELMNEALKQNDIVFVESAIIFEADLEEYFDNILLVASPDQDKIKRVVAQGRMSEGDVRKRLANQIPDSQKKELADSTIQNDKTLVELKIKAEFFLTIFRQLVR